MPHGLTTDCLACDKWYQSYICREQSSFLYPSKVFVDPTFMESEAHIFSKFEFIHNRFN